jgi:RimJ/RimL family protein N-acetyltransferase
MIRTQFELKNGGSLLIREPVIDEAEKLIRYLKKVAKESDFLTIGPGEVKLSVDEEKEFIKKFKKSKNAIFLVAVADDEIVGVLTFSGGNKVRTRHAGDFGITVLKDYWGLGVGSILIETFLGWAKNTKIIRKIELRVDIANKRAISIYKKFGFRKEGKISRDSMINGKFRDVYIMGLEVD